MNENTESKAYMVRPYLASGKLTDFLTVNAKGIEEAASQFKAMLTASDRLTFDNATTTKQAVILTTAIEGYEIIEVKPKVPFASY